MKLSTILFITFTIMFFGCNSNNKNKVNAKIENVVNKNIEKARNHFQKAIKFNKSDNYENALLEINKAIALDTSNYDYQIYLADIKYKLKEYEDAIYVLENVLKKNYKKDTVNFKIGNCYFDYASNCADCYEDELYKNAINYFDKALKINDKFFYAYKIESISLYNIQQDKKAYLLLNKAIKIFPDSLNLVLIKGIVKGSLGDISDEIKDLNFVILSKKLDSIDTSIAYRFRGNAYRNKGRLKLALKDLSNAIKYNNKNEVLYEERGDIYIKLKLFNQACKDYRKCIELGNLELFDKIKKYCN